MPPRATAAVLRAPAAVAARLGRWRARRSNIERPETRWRGPARVCVAALVGAVVALGLAGQVPARVGPFDTTLATRPSLSGRTTVHLAPLGTIELDTHDWPLALDLRVDELRLTEARRIADNPATLSGLEDELVTDVGDAMRTLALRTTLVAIVGGVVGAYVAGRTRRAALAGAGTGMLLVAIVGAGTAATFDAEAVAEPRYSGLLTVAPTAVGDVRSIVDRFGEYREQLTDLVGNVTTLYLTAQGLPTFDPDEDPTVRLLHVSDIHLNPGAFDLIDELTGQFDIDAVLDTGDITDWGTEPETRLVGQIGRLDVPYVWVRGNHDSRRTERAVASQPNAVVLDGESAEVAGVRMWGIGDPRYTPDKDQPVGKDAERDRAETYAPVVGERLATAEPPAVDIALVHDERIATELAGEVPLVLAGHTHEPRQDTVEPQDVSDDDTTDDDSTDDSTDDDTSGDASSADAATTTGRATSESLLLVEGSTGGAGLRGLQGEDPEPLTCSILYIDPETDRLVAYDRVTVGGLGETGAEIDRHVVARRAR